MSASPAATAVPDPLDEPPGILSGSSGLTGVPKAPLIPVIPKASSCRLVLPANRPCPASIAARSPARQAASRSAGRAASATGREPAVVGSPAMSIRSLTATRGPVPGVLSERIQVVTADSVCPGKAGGLGRPVVPGLVPWEQRGRVGTPGASGVRQHRSHVADDRVDDPPGRLHRVLLREQPALAVQRGADQPVVGAHVRAWVLDERQVLHLGRPGRPRLLP